jgi:AcrR family transcriptional regulator
MAEQKSSPRKRGRPPRFTRATVLATALALVDREGAAALSLRRLAGELGVEGMSLYTYVSGRDELLDGITELLVAEVMPADAPGDWRQIVERFCRGWRAAALRHPAATQLAGMRPLRTPESLAIVERLLASLREAGLEPREALAGARLATAFARGYALADIAGMTLVGGDPNDVPEQLVHLRAAAADPDVLDPDAVFERSLALLVEGLAARIATSGPSG